jgi:hypothetical protein
MLKRGTQKTSAIIMNKALIFFNIKKKKEKTLLESDFIPSPFIRSNIIFTHVPKCAGSSVSLSLFGYQVGHTPIEKFYKINPDFVTKAFKFSFVRHPYLRLWSAYNYLIKGGMGEGDKKIVKEHSAAFHSFDTLIEALETSEEIRSIMHFRPQFSFLSVPKTKPYRLYMDFIGKNEFLNRDLKKIKMQLPGSYSYFLNDIIDNPQNVTKRSDILLDNSLIKRVAKIYNYDFQLLGYNEWKTKEALKNLINTSD